MEGLLILIVNYFLLFWPFLFIPISRSLKRETYDAKGNSGARNRSPNEQALELMKMKPVERDRFAQAVCSCLGLLEFLLRTFAPLQWIFPCVGLDSSVI